MRRPAILLLLLAVPLAIAQTAGTESGDALQLFEDAQQRLRSGRPGAAKVAFETLIAVYPESTLVEQARAGIRAAEEQEPKAPVVRSIQFGKFRKVKPQEILDRLREREAALRVDEPCDTRCIEEARAVLADLLAGKGHPAARLLVETRELEPRAIAVTFTLARCSPGTLVNVPCNR